MNFLKEFYQKTHEYFFKRNCSFETQQEVSSSPPKSTCDSILDTPRDKFFRTILRLIVWEQPYLSAFAFVTLNIFYWLIVAWSRRFISIVSIFGIFIFLHRTYTFYCLPSQAPLDKETPKSFSWFMPLSHHSNPEVHVITNEMAEKSMALFKDVWKLRKDNRGLFCSLMCGFFSFLAFIGKVFPGVLIIYGFVLFLTLGPGVVMHLIPGTIFEQFKGFFNEGDSQASPTSTGPSDRDSDLEEFVPDISPETLRQLSLKEDTPEAQSMGSIEGPEESLPAFEDENYVNESDDFSLYQGLGSFPSVEEENESDLDDSDKIIVTPIEKTTEMHFDPKHFKEDSSSGSDDPFTEGLSFEKKTDGASSDVKVKDGIKPRSLSSSDEDELADFEILEESDIPT